VVRCGWSACRASERGNSCASLQCWLPGTQVNADDLALWVRIGELDSPEPGTGADVQRVFELLDRREVQAVAEGESKQVVLKVQPVRFPLGGISLISTCSSTHNAPRHLERYTFHPCTLV